MTSINTFIEHAPLNSHGFLKGNLQKLYDSTYHLGIKDFSLTKFSVNAYSVNDMIETCDKIDRKLENCSVPKDKRQNFGIALVEAINNAQEHGCQFGFNKKVYVHLFNIACNYFIAGVESKGNPIDISKVRKLLDENQPLQPGAKRGRGFILMKNTVDLLFISHHKLNTEIFLGIDHSNIKL